MIDPATLLCERCGYVIDGLAESGNCPECGKPIAESLPARRAGSAWQQAPSRRAAWRTCVQVWRSPRAVFDAMQIKEDGSDRQAMGLDGRLLVWAAFAFAVPLTLHAGLWLAAWATQHHVLGWQSASAGAITLTVAGLATTVTIAALCATVPGAFILYLLTAIERRGIQFFGRTRGWRVTPQVAEAVCTHACPGWLAGALLGAAPSLLGVALTWGSGTFGAISIGNALALGGWLAGFLLGLLWFETLVYIGVRRCRFANQIRLNRSRGREN